MRGATVSENLTLSSKPLLSTITHLANSRQGFRDSARRGIEPSGIAASHWHSGSAACRSDWGAYRFRRGAPRSHPRHSKRPKARVACGAATATTNTATTTTTTAAAGVICGDAQWLLASKDQNGTIVAIEISRFVTTTTTASRTAATDADSNVPAAAHGDSTTTTTADGFRYIDVAFEDRHFGPRRTAPTSDRFRTTTRFAATTSAHAANPNGAITAAGGAGGGGRRRGHGPGRRPRSSGIRHPGSIAFEGTNLAGRFQRRAAGQSHSPQRRRPTRASTGRRFAATTGFESTTRGFGSSYSSTTTDATGATTATNAAAAATLAGSRRRCTGEDGANRVFGPDRRGALGWGRKVHSIDERAIGQSDADSIGSTETIDS